LKTISVIGLGHVGLVNAVCFTRRGYKVIGVDTDQHKLRQVRNAEPPFLEASLPEYLRNAINRNLLQTTDDASLNAQADFCFMAVETPAKSDGSVDLSHVEAASIAIGRSLRNNSKNQLIVVLSTVPPGTARNLVTPILERESGKSKGQGFNLCSNPEFFRQGEAIHDTEQPDRIIIGGDEQAITRLETFYRDFYGDREYKVLRTTHENAELIKYANSTFIAAKISLINFIADIAERVPFADVKVVAKGIGLDQRIGPGALQAGIGWGGPCLPKDTLALTRFSESLSLNTDLIQALRAVNTAHGYKAVRLAKQMLGSLKGKRIAVLGLAFKADTNDMKDAPSISIIKSLVADGAHVVAYDPKSTSAARSMLGDEAEYASDPLSCIEQADCCIIVTEWNEFKQIRPETFLKRMKQPIVIDGRRIYDVDAFSKAGVRMVAFGAWNS
jgi:UDPglucose 6-dehydrogenase